MPEAVLQHCFKGRSGAVFGEIARGEATPPIATFRVVTDTPKRMCSFSSVRCIARDVGSGAASQGIDSYNPPPFNIFPGASIAMAKHSFT